MAASDAKETTMSQQQKDALKDIFRNAPLDIGGDPIGQHTNFEKMLSAQPLADDVTATPGELGGVPVLNIETGESSHDAVMLWFHGGWYVIGSPRTSAGLSSDLSRRVDAKVISVDYRLAPEDPYPAAVQDARAAYRGLLDSGVDPGSIAIVGESAAVVWRWHCSTFRRASVTPTSPPIARSSGRRFSRGYERRSRGTSSRHASRCGPRRWSASSGPARVRRG